MQSPIRDYWSTLVIYAFILFYFHYTCFIHINEFICIIYMQMKIVPTHCCRYWNIGSNGSATCLDTAMAQKKEFLKKSEDFFFVDSTILVNGNHIYSTACYYNSSVSNLYFACWDDTSRLHVCQFSAFLRPFPLSNFQEHVSKRSEFPQSMTGDYMHCSLLCHYDPVLTVGRKLEANVQETWEEICLLFHFCPQVWLTGYAHLGGGIQHEDTRKLTVPFPGMSLESKETVPCHRGALGNESNEHPMSKQWLNAKHLLYISPATQKMLAGASHEMNELLRLVDNMTIKSIQSNSIWPYSIQAEDLIKGEEKNNNALWFVLWG